MGKNMKQIPKILQEINEESYVISDTHFRHDKIFKFEPVNAELCKLNGVDITIENRDKIIVEQWNDIVKDDDIIIHLGDFSWKSPQEHIKKLRGRKVLMLGNHDRKGEQVYKDFDYVVRGFIDIRNNMFQVTESDDKLFSVLALEFGGYDCLFSHYPSVKEEYRNPNINRRIDNIIEIIGKSVWEIDVHFHGHTHNKSVKQNSYMKLINCSQEVFGFKPRKIKELLKC